jgi:hypothetical protein
VSFPVSGRNFDKARQTSLLFDGSIDARTTLVPRHSDFDSLVGSFG